MKENGKIKIFSTIAQIGDLAEEIGGERVDVLVLVKGDLNPHTYELVKGDGEKFERADLVLYNGLGLEHAANLSSFLKTHPKAVAVGEKIRSIYPEKILMRGDSVDPHLWMDVSLWAGAVDPIADSLSQVDPEGASYYRERAARLVREMDAMHQKIREKMLNIPAEKRYLVTSHDAFQYFTRGYLAEPDEENWGERFAAPEGLAPDSQLNSRDIQRIIEFLSQKKIEVLFPESNVSRDSIRKIASAGNELGLTIHICTEPLYGDSMSGLSYLEMMEKNAEVIAKHINRDIQ